MQRRDFLKLTGGVLTGSVLTSQVLQAGALTPMGGEVAEKHITAYIVDPKNGDYQAYIRRDNMPLTVYRAGVHQKYPYFYPVAGPKSGISLTSESSQPWPHHRSLFFGLDRVNGGNYWQDVIARGQIVSQKVKLGNVTETSAEIIDRCLWSQPGQDPIMEDQRLFTLTSLENGDYLMDAEITMKSLVDVTVAKTNHGLFGVRVAHDISPVGGGNLLNSEGKAGEQATYGQPARWMTFYGKRANTDITEGIAVLTHPKFPDTEKFPTFKDCPWFTRDYGNCSPMPMNFFDQPLVLPQGESISLKYRVVAYAGMPKDAGLDRHWEDFSEK